MDSLATALAEVPLEHRFADALPQLAIPWTADEVAEPRILVANDALARELGLDPEWLRSEEGRRFLVGNALPEGAKPVAQAYAGHQFGFYSPRLGDGRALLLGELGTADGLRDLHLKGSGPTPFSRDGDGLAAIGPMLREHLVGEAMHALGIPTTRSLAVVATGAEVRRGGRLPGALLVRVARSHLRVGTFQFAAANRDRQRGAEARAHAPDAEPDVLRALVDHAIERHHPEAASAPHPVLALLEAVAVAQARLVAAWLGVGFVHGVMNTDNTTISGETIDYGPCAFIDRFDVGAVFSSIDHLGRYALRNQPAIAQWNIARLADALLPLIDDDRDRAVERATESVNAFGPAFAAAWRATMRAKLGLADDAFDDDAAEHEFVEELLVALHDGGVDWTGFFRDLGDDGDAARARFADPAAFDAWAARWRALDPDRAAMAEANPVVIPRNHLVEEALAAAQDDGDLAPFERLLAAVTDPFARRPEHRGPEFARYAEPAPDDFGRYVTFCGT
ncbi:MAG: YdiU family protein [Microbacteriaceae bacterium]|nr:YdiU family protein [Microbacteriaceae bacterium]